MFFGIILVLVGGGSFYMGVRAMRRQDRAYKAGDYHAIVGFGALAAAICVVLGLGYFAVGVAMIATSIS